MEFLQDWKFYLFSLNIIVLLFNIFSHFKITQNDLVHLTADVKTVITKVDRIESRVSKIEGKLEK